MGNILQIPESAFFNNPSGLLVPDEMSAKQIIIVQHPEAVTNHGFHSLRNQSPAPVILAEDIADLTAQISRTHMIIVIFMDAQ